MLKMLLRVLFVFSLDTVFVVTYQHQKFLHKTLWNERCKKHDVALNDCNWCWCDHNQKYVCKARVCAEVDMFGHFQDAIQAIDVGMEGHGVWRSTPSACLPGLQYRRGDMLCVCNEDGNWPNPVCRDALRVLHAVEVTELTYPSKNYTCFPNKLYLVGCNVCFCSMGYLDPNLCTNTTCYKNDEPISNEAEESTVKNGDLEVYATCEPNTMYSLGCMSCKCLRNNRLLCQPCAKEDRQKRVEDNSFCSGGSSNIFYNGCNLCYCDGMSRRICTIRNCIAEDLGSLKEDFKTVSKSPFKLVPRPIDYEDCTPGTTFHIDCNNCRCMINDGGKKIIQCTMKLCNKTDNIDIIKHDCVLGSTYESKCMTCVCATSNGVKIQTCARNRACSTKVRQSTDVASLNGYCEPLHMYTDGCNQCRCLADGETVVCTTKMCKNQDNPVSIEIVPVKLRSRDRCPKGRSFLLNCNMCFCLSNGNSMCTTSDCGKNKKVYPIIH